jgi:hypothetical protein
MPVRKGLDGTVYRSAHEKRMILFRKGQSAVSHLGSGLKRAGSLTVSGAKKGAQLTRAGASKAHATYKRYDTPENRAKLKKEISSLNKELKGKPKKRKSKKVVKKATTRKRSHARKK